jgi:hypothetical protein
MSPTPEEDTRRLYEEAEARTAQAVEEIVGGRSFGELLAKVTDNVVALTHIGNDTWDLVVPNLRLGRAARHHTARPSAVAHGGQARAGASGARGRA